MHDQQSLREYKERVLRVIRYSSVTILLFSIGIISPYRSFFLGLTLGVIVSMINYAYTAWKVNRIGEIAIQTSKHKQKRRFITAGMSTRMATSLLAAMAAFNYPDLFYLFSTLFGLFVVQIIAVVDGIIHT